MSSEDSPYYTYVLYSKAFDRIYIGFSADVYRRLEAHNHPNNKGYTKRFQPWELIHVEEANSKQKAMKREKELKSYQGRKWIRSLIKKN